MSTRDLNFDLDLDLDTLPPFANKEDLAIPDSEKALDALEGSIITMEVLGATSPSPPATGASSPTESEGGRASSPTESITSSVPSYIETLHLRVRPDPENALKRIITSVMDDEEEISHQPAQILWDMEEKVQREIVGLEKFEIHTWLFPPVATEPVAVTYLIVEFMDSGRIYKWENLNGLSHWNFVPMLGGFSYYAGIDGTGMGNLYGFHARYYDFFHANIVPVTLRIFRYLTALLDLRDPLMMCDEAEEIHDHYPIKIIFSATAEGKPEYTKHLVCGNIFISSLFESLYCDTLQKAKGMRLSRLGRDSKPIEGRGGAITYRQACQRRVKVAQMGYPKGCTLYFLAEIWEDEDTTSPTDTPMSTSPAVSPPEDEQVVPAAMEYFGFGGITHVRLRPASRDANVAGNTSTAVSRDAENASGEASGAGFMDID